MSQENVNELGHEDREAPTTSREPEASEASKRHSTSESITMNLCSNRSVSGSPPTIVSFEELIKAANDVTKMVLAHEITFNKDFRIQKFNRTSDSPVKKVQEAIHAAFWNTVRKELNDDPPNYKQAFSILNEIKVELLNLLLPQHTAIRQQISEVLDLELIKQQALAGTLDFQPYAQYVISVMGKICAPIRDDKIAELNQTKDIIDVFKGIFETLELMRLDMANFTIDLMRPHIVASSVEYEKKKFADYLKFSDEALILTRKWLRKHYLDQENSNQELSKIFNTIINNAFLELLEWDIKRNLFPETIVIDDARLIGLGKEYRKLTLAGAVLLITYSHAGQDLSSITEFKEQLKNHTLTLLDNLDEVTEKDRKSLLENVSIKLRQDMMNAMEKYGVRVNNEEFPNFTVQIAELANDENKILMLLRQRIKQFLLDTISSQTSDPVKIPTGFSSFKDELTKLGGVFMRWASYNRAVYDEYYKNIIEEFAKERS